MGWERGATRPAAPAALPGSGTATVPGSAWMLAGGESKGSSQRQVNGAAAPPNIIEMATTTVDAADYTAIAAGTVTATASATVTAASAYYGPPGSSARNMPQPPLATVPEEDPAALRSGAESKAESKADSRRGSGSESTPRQGPGAGGGAGSDLPPGLRQGQGFGPAGTAHQRPVPSMTTAVTFAQESRTRSRNVDDVEADLMSPSGTGLYRGGSVENRGSSKNNSRDSGKGRVGKGGSVKGRDMIRALSQQSSDSPYASIATPAPIPVPAPVHAPVPAPAPELVPVPAPVPALQVPGSLALQLSLRGIPASPDSGGKPSYNLLIVDDSALNRKVP